MGNPGESLGRKIGGICDLKPAPADGQPPALNAKPFAITQMIDHKAYKILQNTYWSSSGWNKSPAVSPDDFKYAKKMGVMFDSVSLNHREICDLVRQSISKVKQGDVVNGFLASLSTHRLDLRSALGSYATARYFPKHGFRGEPVCQVCGVVGKRSRLIDTSRLNFERLKWGGVSHWDPIYTGFDLNLFSMLDVPMPTKDDRRILARIIETAKRIKPEQRPRKLEESLSSVFESNRHEREIVIQILGYCGILQPTGFQSYYDGFIKYKDRSDRSVYKIDWAYPVSWWQGKHGVNDEALRHYFPSVWDELSTG